MSDFTSNFWAVYVAAITVVSMAACLLLLWFSGKARAMTAGDNTTAKVTATTKSRSSPERTSRHKVRQPRRQKDCFIGRP